MYWHVHTQTPMIGGAYCAAYPEGYDDIYHPTGYSKARHVADVYESYGSLVVSSDYPPHDCPYQNIMAHFGGTPIMARSTPTKAHTEDGQAIDLSNAVCEGCGEPLASHKCGGRMSNKGVKRRDPSEHPACPHCGGRVHFNMSGTAINAECLNRQYSLDNGDMTDPNSTMPVLTLTRMEEIVKWAGELADAPTYGKMESAAGGAGTYSGLRPKTGRKKKALAAGKGEKIEDVAETVDAPKSKKGKKSKAAKAAATEAPAVSVEEAIESVEVEATPKRNRKAAKANAPKPEIGKPAKLKRPKVVEPEPEEIDPVAAAMGDEPDDDDEIEVIEVEPEDVIEAVAEAEEIVNRPRRSKRARAAEPVVEPEEVDEPEDEAIEEAIEELPTPKRSKRARAAEAVVAAPPVETNGTATEHPLSPAERRARREARRAAIS